MKSTEAYVVEESVVDPKTGTMTTRTMNLNHQKTFTVEELQTYTKSPEDQSWYIYPTIFNFILNFVGHTLRHRPNLTVILDGLGFLRGWRVLGLAGLRTICRRVGTPFSTSLSASLTRIGHIDPYPIVSLDGLVPV